MKIYMVFEEFADSEMCVANQDVQVFLSYGKAKERFDNIVKDIKENDILFEESCDDTVVEESETEFVAYQDGFYFSNHITVSIKEAEIECHNFLTKLLMKILSRL